MLCGRPVMDGLDATVAIRSDPRIDVDHQPYVIALTANAMAGDKAKCLDAGMELFLSKPVTLGPVIQALKTAHAATAKKQRLIRQRVEAEEARRTPGEGDSPSAQSPASLSSPSYRPTKLSQRRPQRESEGAGLPASAGMVGMGVEDRGERGGSGGDLGKGSASLSRISSAPLRGYAGGGGGGGPSGDGVVDATPPGSANSRVLASQQFLASVALQPFSPGSPQTVTVFRTLPPPPPPPASSTHSASHFSSSSSHSS